MNDGVTEMKAAADDCVCGGGWGRLLSIDTAGYVNRIRSYSELHPVVIN